MPTPFELAQAGYALCAIDSGKGPTYPGWNTIPIPVDACDGLVGAGILHVQSRTAALDIDDMQAAVGYLQERNIDLVALLSADDRVEISSGRTNRAKLIYRMTKPMRTVRPAGSGIELRSATAEGKSVQDKVFGLHPQTGKPYEIICGLLGDWRAPPPIPAALLTAWRELAEPFVPPTDIAPPTDAPDVALLRALIEPFDPNASYPDWIKSGMKLHHASGGSPTGLAVWLEWSQRSKKVQRARRFADALGIVRQRPRQARRRCSMKRPPRQMNFL